jgi:hypothetical protein
MMSCQFPEKRRSVSRVSQLLRFPLLPAYNGPDDGHPGDPLRIADRMVHAHVHLIQTFVHPPDPVRLFPHQHGFLANDAAPFTDLLTRTIAAVQ